MFVSRRRPFHPRVDRLKTWDDYKMSLALTHPFHKVGLYITMEMHLGLAKKCIWKCVYCDNAMEGNDINHANYFVFSINHSWVMGNYIENVIKMVLLLQ